jgi:apolipoprotein N-acyltransferase
VLWNSEGERAGVGGKVHLVPGAEELCGLERFGWVRALADSIAGYVPDIVGFERAEVLTLETRDGRRFRFGVSVCFDNAYDDPYTGPLREGDLDFHLVASNEAWYRESFEYDQMVAFSRLAAIATGRAMVRATNAGITMVLAPDGREVDRLRSAGKDRMVAGALPAVVPVPRADDRTSPVYVRTEGYWLGAWLALPLVLLASRAWAEATARRADASPVTAASETGRGSAPPPGRA